MTVKNQEECWGYPRQNKQRNSELPEKASTIYEANDLEQIYSLVYLFLMEYMNFIKRMIG